MYTELLSPAEIITSGIWDNNSKPYHVWINDIFGEIVYRIMSRTAFLIFYGYLI